MINDSEKKVLMPRMVGLDPNVLAAEICSVQPMPNNAINAFSELYKAAKSRDELIEEGYKPVSNLGLLWIKDDKR